jgi:hypothetical protein
MPGNQTIEREGVGVDDPTMNKEWLLVRTIRGSS